MSFKPGTILERKEPFPTPDEHSEDADLTPFNEIRVVGQSPVTDQGLTAEWGSSTQASLISVTPTSFGPVIDKPFGELQRDYSVVSEPPRPTLGRGEVEAIEPGPSPEEVFEAETRARGEETPAKKKVTQPDPDAPSPEEIFAATGVKEESHKLAATETFRREAKPKKGR